MTPTRSECVTAAARIYEGILADPVRAAQIRAARAARSAERTAAGNPSTTAGGQPVDTARAVRGQRDRSTPSTAVERKSA